MFFGLVGFRLCRCHNTVGVEALGGPKIMPQMTVIDMTGQLGISKLQKGMTLQTGRVLPGYPS